MKVAAIGIGSNSVRMLVIEVEGTSFRRLRRDRHKNVMQISYSCEKSPKTIRRKKPRTPCNARLILI